MSKLLTDHAGNLKDSDRETLGWVLTIIIFSVVLTNLSRVLIKGLGFLKRLYIKMIHKKNLGQKTVQLKPIKVFSTKIEEEVTKDSFEHEEHKQQYYQKNQVKINVTSQKVHYKVVEKPKKFIVFDRNDINA